jgi:hypothetical protein
MLGYNGQKALANQAKEYASDLEIDCSLSFDLKLPPYNSTLLSLLFTSDAYNVLRVY